MSPRLTAVVLTKDEEVNIGDCLKSLQWVDELIVVDSGSTDKTVAIAQNMGARVLVNTPCPFNANVQRNWALDNGELIGDWVIFIDADERVPTRLAEAIWESLANEDAQGYAGYQLAPKFMFMNKWLRHVTHYPAWHDRIVRKGNLHFVGTWPPDKFEPTTELIGRINEPYLHFGLNNGIERWYSKHNTYSSNVAEAAYQYAITGSYNQDVVNRQILIASRFLILGPFLRFIYDLLANGGILDGYPGLVYAMMRMSYQFMIGLKMRELQFREQGKPM